MDEDEHALWQEGYERGDEFLAERERERIQEEQAISDAQEEMRRAHQIFRSKYLKQIGEIHQRNIRSFQKISHALTFCSGSLYACFAIDKPTFIHQKVKFVKHKKCWRERCQTKSLLLQTAKVKMNFTRKSKGITFN